MITIVDYNAGNPTSVKRALASVGVASTVSPLADEVRNAERIIFPGVGHASATMAVLIERGLDRALADAFARGTPILGVCVGAQLSLAHSEEGDTPCLGLVPGRVRRFPELPRELKVPHMGWNRIQVQRPHPLFEGVPLENEFYFVHSYYLAPAHAEQVLATTTHGIEFASAFAIDNFAAVQFHPEKSGPLGLDILERFAHWVPASSAARAAAC
jgi:imidazole glycerol-phosphate synthase subunit HisH